MFNDLQILSNVIIDQRQDWQLECGCTSTTFLLILPNNEIHYDHGFIICGHHAFGDRGCGIC